MNLYFRKTVILFFAIVVTPAVHAQYTKANNDPDADFKLAKKLNQKEQFILAYPLFKPL